MDDRFVRTAEIDARLDAAKYEPDEYQAIIAGLSPDEIRAAWAAVLFGRSPERFPKRLAAAAADLEALRARIGAARRARV